MIVLHVCADMTPARQSALNWMPPCV